MFDNFPIDFHKVREITMQQENIKSTENGLLIKNSQINNEFQKRKKSIFYAYYLCLLMSGLGLHKFYLGDQQQGIRFLSLYWLGLYVFSVGFGVMNKGYYNLGASTFVIGVGTLTMFAAWWFFDILTLYFQTKRKNELIKQEIITSQHM